MYKGLKADCFDIAIVTYERKGNYKRIFSLQEAINYVAEAMELPHNKKILIKRKIRDREDLKY